MIKYLSNKVETVRPSKTISEPKMDLKKELDKIIKITKGRIEKEIPDIGYFRNFGVNLNTETKPDFFGRDISLFIERDEKHEGKAFLGISVLHPTMDIDASVYITNGDRKQLLNYINRSDFNEELQNAVKRLSDSLKKE